MSIVRAARSGVPPYYGTVQDEGVAQPRRPTLNFSGAGVTATDDSGNGKTLVTITGAPAANTAVHAMGNSGTALTLDASSASGWIKAITLTGNCTFTLTGATAGQLTQLELILTQDGTGSRTVTWPGSVKWSGGAPTLTSAPAAVDRVLLTSYNGGTTWYGDVIGKAYA